MIALGAIESDRTCCVFDRLLKLLTSLPRALSAGPFAHLKIRFFVGVDVSTTSRLHFPAA